MIQVNCDLLKQPGVIVQQCNCVTVKAHGLSQIIKIKYPYADIYSQRSKQSPNYATLSTRGIPGTCVISHSEDPEKPIVASLMGQISPGKPGTWAKVYNIDPKIDSAQARLEYFRLALEELLLICTESNESKFKTVSFPYRIRCGLAGGDWSKYHKFLEDFATRATGVQVYLCRIE